MLYLIIEILKILLIKLEKKNETYYSCFFLLLLLICSSLASAHTCALNITLKDGSVEEGLHPKLLEGPKPGVTGPLVNAGYHLSYLDYDPDRKMFRCVYIKNGDPGNFLAIFYSKTVVPVSMPGRKTWVYKNRGMECDDSYVNPSTCEYQQP